MRGEGHGQVSRVALVAGPLLAAVAGVACLQVGLSSGAAWTAAVTVLCALWWVTEPVPVPVTSLVPFVILPTVGALEAEAAAGAYGHPLILLLLGGFLMSTAMERSGAHRRLAVGLVRLLGRGGGARRLVLGVMVATAVCSMWISNTATTLMLLPVMLAVIEQDEAEGRRGLATPLLLGLAYGASIGGMGTPVGTPPNIVLMGIVDELGLPELGFATWMGLGIPVVAVLLPVAWAWLTRHLADRPAPHLSPVGPWTPAERRVLAVFGVAALLWISRKAPGGGWSGWLDLPGASDAAVALGAAVALFLLPDGRGGRTLDWPTARRIPWGLLLLFSGGICIARAFSTTGLAEALGSWLAHDAGLATLPPVATALGICLSVTFLTEVTSNTATTTLLLPVLAAAATAASVDPLAWMVPATFSASCAFMLPVATAPNAVVYGSERVTIAEMAREGLFLNVIGALVITGLCTALLGSP